ncbi:ABC transporter substrate-binding protein [Phaeacidiphilus oryzae]|uniref:ABC transporter substrate-binding protein n=1 Tax=Phaeacidiphilus oryzae TaxID=348818 RepID=UPI00055EF29B|nr:ABC transporter substrate-binding protein [Phaeacidiphilus oryzae]
MALTAVAACSAIALTACGGNNGNSASGKGAGFNAAATKIVNPSTAKGGTLNLWGNQDADFWDPARGYYAFVWDFERLYTRTLVAYPSKPGAAGLKLQPDLATALPTVTDGGKTYTFKLRSGIKFENGDPITSQDIKYGIERVFAQDVLPGGPVYLQQILDEGQKYQGPYKDKDPNKMGLKSVVTPDSSTIVFHLQKADSDFLNILAMGGAAPVEPKMDTGANYTKHPESSGPYKFQSYTPNKETVWVRNPNWSKATDPIRSALPDKITFTVTTNQDDLDSRLINNQIDIDAGQVGVQQKAQAQVLTHPDLKSNTDDAVDGFTRYISIQPQVAPFNNIHCRKAIEYATDPTALQTARGGPTAGALAGNMLPPNIPGHDNYDPYNLTAGKQQVAKAKQELQACGKPNGFSTTIAVRNNKDKEIKSAEAEQAALKAVGITANIDEYDGAQASSVIGAPATVKKKGYGLIVFGWGADYPSGSGFLQPLVDGRFILPAGNNNYTMTNDPTINHLFDEGLAATSPQAAAGFYQQVNHKIMDDALYVPTVWDQALNYRNPRLTNVTIIQELGMVDFQALGVQK